MQLILNVIRSQICKSYQNKTLQLVINGNFSINQCNTFYCLYNTSNYNNQVNSWYPDPQMQTGQGKTYSSQFGRQNVMMLSAQANTCVKQSLRNLSIGKYYSKFAWAAQQGLLLDNSNIKIIFDQIVVKNLTPKNYLINIDTVQLQVTSVKNIIQLKFCGDGFQKNNYGAILKNVSMFQSRCIACPTGYKLSSSYKCIQNNVTGNTSNSTIPSIIASCNQTCDCNDGWVMPFSNGSCSTFCGDNIIKGLEQCDDGNMINFDGCNADCQIQNSTSNSSTNTNNNGSFTSNDQITNNSNDLQNYKFLKIMNNQIFSISIYLLSFTLAGMQMLNIYQITQLLFAQNNSYPFQLSIFLHGYQNKQFIPFQITQNNQILNNFNFNLQVILWMLLINILLLFARYIILKSKDLPDNNQDDENKTKSIYKIQRKFTTIKDANEKSCILMFAMQLLFYSLINSLNIFIYSLTLQIKNHSIESLLQKQIIISISLIFLIFLISLILLIYFKFDFSQNNTIWKKRVIFYHLTIVFQKIFFSILINFIQNGIFPMLVFKFSQMIIFSLIQVFNQRMHKIRNFLIECLHFLILFLVVIEKFYLKEWPLYQNLPQFTIYYIYIGILIMILVISSIIILTNLLAKLNLILQKINQHEQVIPIKNHGQKFINQQQDFINNEGNSQDSLTSMIKNQIDYKNQMKKVKFKVKNQQTDFQIIDATIKKQNKENKKFQFITQNNSSHQVKYFIKTKKDVNNTKKQKIKIDLQKTVKKNEFYQSKTQKQNKQLQSQQKAKIKQIMNQNIKFKKNRQNRKARKQKLRFNIADQNQNISQINNKRSVEELIYLQQPSIIQKK